MDRFEGTETIAVEMLKEAVNYLEAAVGHCTLSGPDSPTADYIVEIDEHSRKINDLRKQMAAEIGL